MKQLLTILLFVVLMCSAQAQLNRSAFGVYGHYAMSSHIADFQSLPSLPCCSPIFHNGSGNGIDAGFLYQMPLAPSWLLSLRLGYLQYGGTLQTDEATTVNQNGAAVAANIHHEIVSKLAAVYFEPLIGFRVTNRLTLMGGALVGSSLTHTFNQTENLTTPSTGSLTVPSIVGTGDIPFATSLHAALTVGAGYDIPLGTGSIWFLSPEVFYSFALTNVVKDQNWRVNTLRVGLALKYSSSPLTMPDAPMGQKSRLVAAVKAFGMQSSDAVEEPMVQLKVEEFLARTHKPLLPYVFFGAGSAEMPLQYHQLNAANTTSFQPEKFNDSSLMSVYYDVLNIVGKRLREHPTAKLSLMGCNSNESSERVNLALSQHRAESVKNYLVTTWGIDATRIDCKSRNLPANPSNVNKDEGNAENRRVELSSNDPDILAPLITRDTLRVSTPPIVRFRSSVEAEAGVGSYSLAASQDNRLIQAFNGSGNVPEQFDWHLEDNATSMPRSETPLQYTLTVKDRNAQVYSTDVQSIPVEQLTIEKKRRERIGDKEIDRYTLMSFGFSQAEIEPDNQRYLENIRKDIAPTATVHIVGSTDTMGDPDFNQNLSEQRANSVSKVLRIKNADVRGIGAQSTFDNSLPEGRFYNRTVRLRVETPVQ